jgi:predicted peptidase
VRRRSPHRAPHLRYGAAFLLTALAAASAAAAPAAKLTVVPWNEASVPFWFDAADSLARRAWPLDTPTDSLRTLSANWTTAEPEVDGSLDEWRLVRWNDLAGTASMVRGRYNGPDDFGLRFALQWTPNGLYFGARLRDDSTAVDPAPVHTMASITLALASQSPLVERYWMGGSRRFRVRTDGTVDGWTDLRNKRPEPFDAAVLVSARTHLETATAASTSHTIELFVPWSALYPALPGEPIGLLANVLVDDVDGDSDKLAAWSVIPGRSASRPAWAPLDFGAGPAPGTLLASLASFYPELACEWVVVPWRSTVLPAGTIEVSARGAWDLRPTRARFDGRGPAFFRVMPLPAADGVWPAARSATVIWRLPDNSQVRHWEVTLPVENAALAMARPRLPAVISAEFGNAADDAVRFDLAQRQRDAMGEWTARRHHATGILVWRNTMWARIDRSLAGAVPMKALREHQLPRDLVLQRGFRSALDGSVQPYALYVPPAAASSGDAAATPLPLLVVLHDIDTDEMATIESTSLVAQCRRRGWALLAPHGRGNAGYLGGGERDVLEAIADVRALLPVDGRRIYLTGLGMGGTGTWLLALRNPQLFAAACIVSGYGDLEQSGIFQLLRYQPAEHGWFDDHNPVRLLRPDPTTAFRIVHGEHDAVISPVHPRVMHARLEELGVAHAYRLDPRGDHGPRFFDDDLQASLDFLAAHARAADGVADAARMTVAGAPIADVFGRGPFAIVYGTGAAAPSGDAALQAAGTDRSVATHLADAWRARANGTAVVLPDTAVTAALRAGTNLVLVGTLATNAVLAQLGESSPVRWDQDTFTVGDKAYPASKYGIAFATLDPAHRDRTWVVVAGMQGQLDLLPNTLFGLGAGYAIVHPTRGLVEVGNFTPESK